MNEEIIDYRILNQELLIPPNLAKQVKVRSFDQDRNYNFYKDPFSITTNFKIEFRLLSYEIEE